LKMGLDPSPPPLELAAQGVAAVEKTPTIAEIEKRHKAEMDALTLHFVSEKQMNQECVVCLDDIKCMALAPCGHIALCRKCAGTSTPSLRVLAQMSIPKLTLPLTFSRRQ